ncbi:MAG: sugar transferase, partial [Halovenus sp.]
MVVLSIVAVLFANHPVPQSVFTTYVPLFNRLDVTVLEGSDLQLAILLTIGALLGGLVPLYKPRPRRVLDVVSLSQKRVIVAGLALATLGYFQWSHRLPRATLVMAIGLLYVTVPLWFVWIRQRVPGDTERALIVGDDTEQIRQIVAESDLPFIGYLCPTTAFRVEPRAIADGGAELEHLGGLSRLEETIVERNVDTVVLAFAETDREEFFGALDVCYDNGVKVKAHGDYADTVLTTSNYRTLVDIDIEPLDTLDYVFKRIFDVLFASAALLVLLPVFTVIAIAIKLDSDGPVFFTQKRTSRFGGEFTFYKFRTMV